MFVQEFQRLDPFGKDDQTIPRIFARPAKTVKRVLDNGQKLLILAEIILAEQRILL